MKINETPLLPQNPPDAWARLFTSQMSEWMRKAAQAINQVASGQIAGAYNAVPMPPTTGTFQVGDFIPNSNMTEMGVVGAKYVLTGWRWLNSPTPGFYEQRSFTGN